MKSTSGYDLTQLIIGSEGTLAMVTEATLAPLSPPAPRGDDPGPYAGMDEIANAVPKIVASGVGPMILEYIDLVSMVGITRQAELELGIPQEVKDAALAYLVVVLEGRTSDRVDEDTAELAEMLAELGAIDVYVLPPSAGSALIAAREKAFWSAKSAGANDLVDMVVPRAQIPAYLAKVQELAQGTGSMIVGCGHAGDGNVHLSVFQGDDDVRHQLLHDLFAAGVAMGGAISGEHGIGSEKRPYLLELEDPTKLALFGRIKQAFDPNGILNPGAIF